MSVSFVFRRKIHVVAIDDGAELHGIGGALERFAFKDDVLVRDKDVAVEMFIEPGSIAVHVASFVAEEMTEGTEQREDKMVEYVITGLCQPRMYPGELHVHIHGQLACQPLQPGYHVTFVREDVDVEPLELQSLSGATVFACGLIVAHLTALEVAQYSPLLVEAFVGLVVLQDKLRMRVILEVTAQAPEVFMVDDKVDVVVPWNEPAMAQGPENVSSVKAAGHAYLLSGLLEIDRHVEEAELGPTKR